MAEFKITDPEIIRKLDALTEAQRQAVADQLEADLKAVHSLMAEAKAVMGAPAPWNLFLDDLRDPPPGREWVVCRSTEEALAAVAERGMPAFASLDHDLGGEDTGMVFLRRLAAEHWDGRSPPPESTVHSANPVGKMNIISFMDSWRRSSSFIQGLGPRGGE
jgi:hypothetical protein